MRNRNSSETENEPVNFWQSYTDLMSALLLMFALIVSSVLMQSMTLYQEKIQEEEAARSELNEQKKVVEKQQEILDNQQGLLENQQKQIEKLVGVKESVIVDLSEKFADTDLVVAVDAETGSIAFDSSILFSSDSYELSESGKAFLEKFIPAYFDVLFNGEYTSYFSEIIIEGHTDTDGTYMYNLDLSQKRALSVCQYCIEFIAENDRFDEASIRDLLTANGRSWSRPIYEEDGTTVDMDASRRVEFKFRLKDDEMIDTMKEILEDDQ